MSETIGATLRRYKGERYKGGHYKGERDYMEISYLREDGEETFTLLDTLEGHRNFTSAIEANREFDARLERRERNIKQS